VLPLSILNRLTRRAAPLLGIVLVSAVVFLPAAAHHDEPLTDSVGVIEGEAISVTGPISVDVVHGQVRTILRSGSDVRVKSGTARVDLIEGGQISICGPAHFSVLKSGGSLTVALETGSIHVHIERVPALTIYTPQIQAQTLMIGDGPQDVVAGFDAQGAMCLRANRGAIRAEQQLTGQSVLIPQAGDVLIVNGQLDSLRTSAGHCACELQVAKAVPPPQPEIAQLAPAEKVRKNMPDTNAEAPPTSPTPSSTKEEPIYQVFMPPLIYDAKAKVQPEVDPKMIVLVRRVRVRPTLIFQGRVEGETVAVVTPPPAPAPPANALKPAAPANDSFVDRVRSFVRKLWSSSS
jgi:hypothetical protein